MGATYYFGISGWLYYQIVSTIYGWMGVIAAPPLVYESNRLGEALDGPCELPRVWAYGRESVSFEPGIASSADGPSGSGRRRASFLPRLSWPTIFWISIIRSWPIPSGKPRKASAGSFSWAWGIPFICPLRFMSGISAGPIPWSNYCDRAAGGVWARADVYRRLCVAVFES